jgi:putative DNA primase/helicase
VASEDKWYAARVAEQIEEHFARDEGGKLYVFKDGCYRREGEGRIYQLVKKIVLAGQWTVHLCNETTEYIRTDAPHLWSRPPLDQINLLNGILDVKTHVLGPHTPEFLSPVQLPVRYDPAATCPHWDEQVNATFPADSHHLAYEIVAWLMLPIAWTQKALLLLGPGGTGKSTYLTGLSAFLGLLNLCALSLQKLEVERFASSRLLGKLANVCADLPSTHLETSATFLAITGGDMIPAEYKFRDSFDFVPFARLIFSANQPPRSKDATAAFFQRWYVLPFLNVYRGTSNEVSRRELDAKLSTPAELSGVLNKALEVLPQVMERGLTVTASMREAHQEFWQNSDPPGVWLNKRTISLPQGLVPCRELLNAFNDDALRKGWATMNETEFGLAVRFHRPHVRLVNRTFGGRRMWHYAELSLLTTRYENGGDKAHAEA